MKLRLVLCSVPFLFIAPAVASATGYDIPPPPAEGSAWILDLAGVIDDADRAEIEATQQKVNADYGAPIVVVTVTRLSDYGATPGELETFARSWFDTWAIGSADQNTGMLMLVSLEDRKARIELGADWGHDWDGHAARIMSGDMIPQFKAGDYSEGIKSGVVSLASMAEMGPDATPPAVTMSNPVSSPSPFPWFLILVIGGPIAFVIFMIVITGGGSSSSGSSWSSSSSSSSWSSGGGGFDSGGGFSGGGGASGDW